MPTRTCADCGQKRNLIAKVRSKRCRSCCSKRPRKNQGWYTSPGGYLVRSNYGVFEYQHRVIMEGILNRKLTSEDFVHHKNGDKQDNRIGNLELTTNSDHARHHMLENGSIRAKYLSKLGLAKRWG